MIFSRDSRSHNRTDVNDRNLSNIYGDASENRQSRRRNNNEEEEKIPNRRQNDNQTNAPMPDNPFDNAYQNGFQFTNMGMRMPPSRGTTSQNTNEPIRINLSRSNTDNQPNRAPRKNFIYLT
jgi:hypothetical protein